MPLNSARPAVLALALGALACGASDLTGTTRTLAIPEQTQARFPACTLPGWTLTGRAAPFRPQAGSLCGTAPCTGLVRGETTFRTRTITVWSGDPHLPAVLAWETCNACRWVETGEVRDVGCGR